MTKPQLIAELEGLLAGRSVEAKVLAALDGIDDRSSMDQARAELALSLAREVDGADDRRSMASISKELRELMDRLDLGDDDDDAFGAGG